MCRVLDQQVDKLFQKQDIEREKARIANGKSHITAFCKSVFEVEGKPRGKKGKCDQV